MYLYFVCSQPKGLPRSFIALRDPLRQCISIFMYREALAFWFFFRLFSVVYTRGGLLCARVIVVVKRVRERDSVVMCHPKKRLSLSLSLAYRWVAQQKFAAFVVRISSSPFSKRSSRRGVMSALLLSKRFEKLEKHPQIFSPTPCRMWKVFPERGTSESSSSVFTTLWVSQISPPRDLKRHANAEREKNGCWITVGRARLSCVFIQRLIYEFASFERERIFLWVDIYIYR